MKMSNVSVFSSDGDLLQVQPEDGWEVCIGHGVNCHGVMGSGIAKAFADNIPGLEESYKKFVRRRQVGELLGRTQTFWWPERDINVLNFFTQRKTGADARARMVLQCVHNWLIERFTFHDELSSRLLIPEIGCGIGGLKWEYMYKMIINEIKTTVEDFLPQECQSDIEIYLVSFTPGVNPVNDDALKLYGNSAKVL
jgi:O-acetyl-ADP-ribose deacetylase (regulator of RNase III)